MKNYTARIFISALTLLLIISCNPQEEKKESIWYKQAAKIWTEALPVGNGSLGAMVYGNVEDEHIQFNEETLWTGAPIDYAHVGAYKHLDEIRMLLFNDKQPEAHKLAMEEFMSVPLTQEAYQPFGDLHISFPGHENYTNYRRELDIGRAINITTYEIEGIKYIREVIASNPDNIIAINLSCNKAKSISFSVYLGTEHEDYSVSTSENKSTMELSVKDGVLRGVAGIKVTTDGIIGNENNAIVIENANSATIWLSAATNYVAYNDVSGDPLAEVKECLEKITKGDYKEIRKNHIIDYQSLYNKFSIDFGTSGRDSIPTDERLDKFADSPDDPSLISLYTQYGRYLMISASREGTLPSNLQGIWNDKLAPPWDSKYTTNINAEMNYWPAELTNLSECHEPFFSLIKDCSETGQSVAKEHYNAEGWVLHHNTDIWRGTAPINHSNHGMWMGGSGWVSSHLWEHYLFTRDKEFLKDRAFPIMIEAARFYSQFLIKDPDSGWLISTPSNSPENGGMVAGPTMDHQIIRSLFKACVEASVILEVEDDLINILKQQIEQIAPNVIGQYGQLQEWMKDVDNPNNKHRHVSHLWGMHPGNDFTWEENPELMEAAKKTLEMRGDDGTGWSLSWKINFWARLLDGDHAFELIKMQFRPVSSKRTDYMGGGGSYPNLFDAHPPFQIDGNFGAPAGIVELMVQSHQSYIEILPALPSALPNGKIKGVCARGGFELELEWENGNLKKLKVLSKAGETCKLRYRGKTVEFETEKNRSYEYGGDLTTG